METALRHFEALPSAAREALLQAAIALSIVAVIPLSLLLSPRAGLAPLGPAAGLALAAAFRLGPRYLTGVALGALAASLLSPQPPAVALAVAGGTVAAAAGGAAILRRGGFELGLARLRDLLCLLAGATAAAAVTAAAGCGAVYLAGAAAPDWASLWWSYAATDALGVLLLAPALLTVGASPRTPRAERPDSAALAALRRSEADYRLLVENQDDFILKLDPLGRILFASPRLAEQLGTSADQLVGLPACRLLESHAAAAAAAAWKLALEPPYGFRLEQPLETPSGRRWVVWAAKSVIEQDRVAAVVVVGRDVTERHLADARARLHLQQLAHVGRVGALGELAAGLAHELNQPLCAITSFSQASLRLLPADSDPDLRDAMERIASNARRAGDIISQMRALARKEGQQRQAADLNHLIDEVIGLTGADARHHGVRLELDLAAGLPPVEVAPIQIQQVLVNLIRNAVEAMVQAASVERHIRISSRLADGEVEVSVSDSGPGLPPELLDQIFHPFVTTKTGGLGLGLSISRSIIEAHGGVLSAHCPAAGGTEFRFSLRSARCQSRAGQADATSDSFHHRR